MSNDANKKNHPPTKVMFDGACPLCIREIGLYRHLKPNAEISWVDVSACDYHPPAGLDKNQLMKRFHVMTPEGEILSGAQAFVFVWNCLPGWRWLGFCSRFPGMIVLMEWLYRGFLMVRPALQKLVRKLVARH